MGYLHYWLSTMSFSARVIALRKQRNLTQQSLADLSGIHVQQIKRYEAGHAQPTAEALKRLALALHATTDALLFEEGERGPSDDLALLFEAINDFSEAEKETVRTVLSGMVLQHSARKLDAQRAPAKTQGAKR
jgi:transcriptional regulator with XRE-family HTH domain